MILWNDDLVEAIARRRCVIVIGAGVSKNSTNKAGKRPASWEEFLTENSNGLTIKDCVDDLIHKRDFLTACELIKVEMGSDTFTKLVQKEYQQSGYDSALIHKHIYNLDSSIVLSPNFDSIYDTYASTISSSTIVIKDHTSQDIASYLHGGNVRLLLKTHGSANDPENIIFTRNDYAKARTKYVLFYEILKALVLTHTFLFIGCGTDDPDIRMLFEDVQFAYGRMPFHYMTLPQAEVHAEILKMASESMRIKFIEYDPKDGHLALTEAMEFLVKKVDEFRLQKAVDLKW